MGKIIRNTSDFVNSKSDLHLLIQIKVFMSNHRAKCKKRNARSSQAFLLKQTLFFLGNFIVARVFHKRFHDFGIGELKASAVKDTEKLTNTCGPSMLAGRFETPSVFMQYLGTTDDLLVGTGPYHALLAS